MSIAQAWMREVRMKCQQCGYERVPAGARWCPKCEQELPAPAISLADAFSHKIIDYRKLIARSTEGFVGRQWVRDAVDGFLRATGPRCFLLLGEPGSGKTSFMADLVERRGYPHHFIGKGSLSGVAASLDWRNPIRFAESLGYQLLRDYGGWIMDWESWGIEVRQEVRDLQGMLIGQVLETFQAVPRPADRPVLSVDQEVEQFGAAARVVGVYIENFRIQPEQVVRQLLTVPLTRIAQRWPEHQVVLVVDGLDEAEGYSDPGRNILHLLPDGSLRGNVRFVLSSRPGEHLSHDFLQQVQPFWLSEDAEGQQNPGAIEDAKAYVVQLVQEKTIREMLEEHELEGDLLGNRVAEASRGNFLYLYHYAQGLRGGDETLLDLKALPQGLHGIYQDFLVKVRDKVDNVVYWDQYCKPVLGALAVAREPLLPGQIAGFSGVEKGSVGTILTLVRQFLERIGPEEARRYAVYHSSFGEYLISERNRDCISCDEAHRRVVAYYRRRATSWEDVDWHEVDDYGLRHTAYHLFGAGRELYEDLYELINPDWRRLKLDRLKSDQSFIQDVEWALEAARREKTNRFPRYISLSLMAGSIASKSNDVVPEAIGAMMALGQTERANAYIRTMTDPGIQAGALLQMARALWYLGNQKQANEHLERAIEVGKSAHSILTNPEPLIKDLILLGRTDEMVAVGNLLHRRMGSIWNSSLARTLREMAAHILQVRPGRISQLRTRYPDSFGHLVTLDGAVDESYSPPIDEKLMSSGLQSFEPDPEAQEIYEPCLELLQQADLRLSQGDTDAAWKSIAEIESIGRQNDWVLSGRGSFSDASEPWWSMLALYAQVGSTERLDHLIGEIERSLTLSGPAAWGGKFAFSAALGEIAITWARLGNKRQANGMLERVLRFCEMVGYMEWSIGALKMEFALDAAFGYDLYAVSTAVSATLDQGWHAEYARLRTRRAGWRPWWQHPWWQPPVYR